MAVRQDLWRSKKGRRNRKVWVVDFIGADGARYQERSPAQSKRGARSYELARKKELEAEMLAAAQVIPTIPTFGMFSEEFMHDEAPTTSGYMEMKSKRSMLDRHLLPRFRDTPLDAINVRDIKRLIGDLRAMPRSDKTVNNITTVLRTILLYAKEVEILDKVPRITLLKVPPQEFDFLDFDEYQVLLEGVRRDLTLQVAVLLGAEAGLRAGEIIGLQWQDVNFELNRLKVLRQFQQGRVLPPKWNSTREVQLTVRLARTLKAHRHLKGQWVLMRPAPENGPWTKEVLRWQGERAYRLAKLPQPNKPWHCLRHTFCSHLAMRGVHAKAIQELAGHKSLTTTMRYMHLTPSALQDAIKKLNEPAPWADGDKKVEKKW